MHRPLFSSRRHSIPLRTRITALLLLAWVFMPLGAMAEADTLLEGAAPLTWEGDLATRMVSGMHTYLDRVTAEATKARPSLWQLDHGSAEAYVASLAPKRERLRAIIGAVDERAAPRLETLGDPIAEGTAFKVFAVRWDVFRGVHGEGLLLEPGGVPVASVVALPDCDWTPEMLAGLTPGISEGAQFARKLAESGCRVLLPMLIDRQDTWSGHPDLRMTNQPHREFVYRPAYQMGRHIIGYEVQKVLAAVDWFKSTGDAPVAVAGYGEGGLIALYAAAIDVRIEGALVSGYFQPRETLHAQPIYRNVWSLLREFGDAGLAAMIAPRTLVIDASRHPEIPGPPAAREGRSGAAPGAITTPSQEAVAGEFATAVDLAQPYADQMSLTTPEDGLPVDSKALDALLMGLTNTTGLRLASLWSLPQVRALPDPGARMKRQFDELMEDTQALVRESPYVRNTFWERADATSVETWTESSAQYRQYFSEEVIGALPEADLPPNPRSRMIYDAPTYRGYEVVLDLYEDVFAYGILLVPKNIRKGERRPVVVCQHGLEGRPQEITDASVDSPYYHRFGCQLAEQGFVVFAPQNPYIGYTDFRQLQRKANPLKLSLFSFIVRQHEAILKWLAAQPFVDPDRMAFYGLSYGGKTAMRVPAILEQYCLSICSGDFNEWIWKTTSNRSQYSYLFTSEYEMFEFNLGNTFNYAELSKLIFPRPFMVERGHHDGVAPDEWVAYEFAKTFFHYDTMGLGDRAELEFFDGPHTIHGVGTFAFLRKHLDFPGKQRAELFRRGTRVRRRQ